MEYELKKGCALVLDGPQGCGKNTLAREIASKHGTYSETQISELESPFGLAVALDGEPNTLIVDGYTARTWLKEKIKGMLSNDTVLVDRKHQTSKLVKTPNFIFCTQDRDPIKPKARDRRFMIVEMK